MWWGRLVLMGAVASSALAEQGAGDQMSESETVPSLAITMQNIVAAAQMYDASPTGVDVRIEGAPTKIGTFRYTTITRHMGANFGKSITTERSNPPVYFNPIVGGA